jgi:hypothetical protein
MMLPLVVPLARVACTAACALHTSAAAHVAEAALTHQTKTQEALAGLRRRMMQGGYEQHAKQQLTAFPAFTT